MVDHAVREHFECDLAVGRAAVGHRADVVLFPLLEPLGVLRVGRDVDALDDLDELVHLGAAVRVLDQPMIRLRHLRKELVVERRLLHERRRLPREKLRPRRLLAADLDGRLVLAEHLLRLLVELLVSVGCDDVKRAEREAPDRRVQHRVVDEALEVRREQLLHLTDLLAEALILVDELEEAVDHRHARVADEVARRVLVVRADRLHELGHLDHVLPHERLAAQRDVDERRVEVRRVDELREDRLDEQLVLALGARLVGLLDHEVRRHELLHLRGRARVAVTAARLEKLHQPQVVLARAAHDGRLEDEHQMSELRVVERADDLALRGLHDTKVLDVDHDLEEREVLERVVRLGEQLGEREEERLLGRLDDSQVVAEDLDDDGRDPELGRLLHLRDHEVVQLVEDRLVRLVALDERLGHSPARLHDRE